VIHAFFSTTTTSTSSVPTPETTPRRAHWSSRICINNIKPLKVATATTTVMQFQPYFSAGDGDFHTPKRIFTFIKQQQQQRTITPTTTTSASLTSSSYLDGLQSFTTTAAVTNDDISPETIIDPSSNNNDPIVPYLDVYPNPSDYPISPVPNSNSQLVVNDSNNNNYINNNDNRSTESSSTSSMDDVLSAIQSTVSSLSTVARSLSTTGNTSPSTTTGNGHESLVDPEVVMEALFQQDETITNLEDSIDGLRDIQVQSSELIQMVSQNQMQMTERVTDVQSEVMSLRFDQETTQEKNVFLTMRIDELEAKIDSLTEAHDSIAKRTSKTEPEPQLSTAKRRGMIEVEPNLRPLPCMGERFRMLERPDQ